MSIEFMVGFLALGVLRCYYAGCNLMARKMFGEVVIIGLPLIIGYFYFVGGGS